MNSWELYKSGYYQKAIEVISGEIVSNDSVINRNNRAFSYLHLGNYSKAIEDFIEASKIHKAETGSDGDNVNVGVAYWLWGEKDKAMEVWEEGVNLCIKGTVKYGDIAGGVTPGNILYFGSVMFDNNESKKLATALVKKRLGTKQSTIFPGHVSRFLLNQYSQEEMLREISSTEILKERQLCIAWFYIATKAYENKDKNYPSYYHKAYDFGSKSKIEAEYFLAMKECNKDKTK